MKLNLNALENKDFFNEANIKIASYDIDVIKKNTSERPTWVHFGAGNIFKAFIARAMDDAIESGKEDTGIVTIFNRDFDQIDSILKPNDLLTMSVSMSENGDFNKRIISSVTDALKFKEGHEDLEKIRDIFRSPSLSMVSFTITEKGYAVKNMDGHYNKDVIEDIKNGPSNPKNTMAQLASLLLERFKASKLPIAVVSMDNCSHNGDKLKDAIRTIALEWLNNKFVSQEFIDYLDDRELVSFPYSMIDKITPRPSSLVSDHLTELGIEGMDLKVDERGFESAAFVNAEISEYLIIEDWFPNSRPRIESEHIIFTTREIVNKVETMKVTTCLNPLHTALAVTGCLLGHKQISDEMKDDILLKLVEKIGYDEGLKVVINPGIIDPRAFIDEVVYKRFMNPFIPDTPQRIATDTSQKIAIRFGETIKSYEASSELETSDLVGIPLALASWLRYLIGVNDEGLKFTLSPDPMLEELGPYFDIKLGEKVQNISKILSSETIFGVNLYDVNLGLKVEKYLNEMLEGKGSVRKTLERYL